MSSGSGPSTSMTVCTASASSVGGGVSPTTPTSTTLTTAVVSLLGSLVRNIVRSKMASASGHPSAGSVPTLPAAPVPAIPLAPPLVPSGSSSSPVVLSSTNPAGVTSGMSCYSVLVMLGHPPLALNNCLSKTIGWIVLKKPARRSAFIIGCVGCVCVGWRDAVSYWGAKLFHLTSELSLDPLPFLFSFPPPFLLFPLCALLSLQCSFFLFPWGQGHSVGFII